MDHCSLEKTKQNNFLLSKEAEFPKAEVQPCALAVRIYQPTSSYTTWSTFLSIRVKFCQIQSGHTVPYSYKEKSRSIPLSRAFLFFPPHAPEGRC